MCWINDIFMNVILCVLVLPSKSLDNEEYVYLLATALYMADDQGKYVLLDEALPPSIEAIIKQHALSLLDPSTQSKTIIKVVPRPHHLQPFNSNPNILRVDLREMTSRKHFMSGMWDSLKNFWDKKILRKGNNNNKKTKLSETRMLKAPIVKLIANNLDIVTEAVDVKDTIVTDSTDGAQTSITERADTAGVTDASDEVLTTIKTVVPAINGVQWVNTKKEHKDNEETWLENPKPTSDAEEFKKEELKEEELKEEELKEAELKKEELEEYQPTRNNEYVPNDIYYSIEKKCVNWSDGCQLNLPSILEQPASAFKYQQSFLMQPKKNLWNP